MGFGASTALAAIQSVSQVIVVGENINRGDPEFWDVEDSTRVQGHLGMTNFLFVDGHVKSMKMTATVTPVNLWNNDNTAPPNGNLAALMAQQQARINQ